MATDAADHLRVPAMEACRSHIGYRPLVEPAVMSSSVGDVSAAAAERAGGGSLRRVTALLGVVGLLLAGCSSGRAGTSNPDAVTRSAIYAGLSMSHPAAWRLIIPTAVGHGSGVNVAYLTDQPAHPTCTFSAHETSCRPPVSSLQSDGVLVTFADSGLMTLSTSHNRVLAGHDADVEAVDPSGAACPANATSALRMTLWLSRTVTAGTIGGAVIMTACYSGPDAARITADLDAMVNSVAFT